MLTLLPSKLKLITTIAILLLSVSQLVAQKAPIKFERISLDQGLSMSAAYCVVQDHKGYIWVCTADGLNKYDGTNFKHYKFNPSDTNSISENYIHTMYVDNSHNIWVGTRGGGLDLYDSISEEFSRYMHYDSIPTSISNNIVNYINEDANGNLWVGTLEGGINILPKGSRDFKHSYNTESLKALKGLSILAIARDGNGMMWVGTDEGLFMIDPTTLKAEKYDQKTLKKNLITSLRYDNKGRLWIGLDGLRLYELDIDKKQITKHRYSKRLTSLYPDDAIQSIYYDALNDVIWAGTRENGVIKHVLQQDTVFNYQHNPVNPYSLSNNSVFSIIKDKAGILWLGTNLGINKNDPQHERFILYRNNPEIKDDLSSSNVYAVIEDEDGYLWIGTRGGGLNRYDPKTDTYKYILQDDQNVSAIKEDSKGNLWVGYFDGGVYKIENKNSANPKYTHYTYSQKNSNCLSSNIVSTIYIDKNGLIWIGTFDNGINVYDPVKDKFSYYPYQPYDEEGISHFTVLSFYEDSKDNFWISTFGGGLNLLDRQTGKFTHYKNNEQDSTSISHNSITSVYEDTKGRMWVCTFGGGLNLMDRDKGTFKTYTHVDGLPNDAVYGILEDNEGNLWMSTNRGLSKFNPDKETFKNFELSDDLQSYEFNQGAFFKANDGKFYFGGINGLNAFYPDNVKDNPFIPNVLITAFKKFDKAVSTPLYEGATITLKYRENFISFDFVALSYTNSSKNQYAYKLEGFNDDWVYCGTRKYASYTNLEPGEYIFRVKGSNNDGVWNEEGTFIKLIVKPMYWQTSWFKFGMVFIILWVIALVFYLVTRNIRKKSQLRYQTELVESELKALRSQMNPHFIFNSLNSIQQFITNSERKSALIYLSKFAKLIRLILENSQRNYVQLHNEVVTLDLYMQMEKLRFEERFDYQFVVESSIDQHNIEVPSMLIQPYIENAIIHGLVHHDKGGLLRVELKQKGNMLICVIEDNGIGRERAMQIKARKASQYKSMGMSVTKQRLEILNADKDVKTSVKIKDLKDNEGKPIGTRVEITIPIEYHEKD